MNERLHVIKNGNNKSQNVNKIYGKTFTKVMMKYVNKIGKHKNTQKN